MPLHWLKETTGEMKMILGELPIRIFIDQRDCCWRGKYAKYPVGFSFLLAESTQASKLQKKNYTATLSIQKHVIFLMSLLRSCLEIAHEFCHTHICYKSSDHYVKLPLYKYGQDCHSLLFNDFPLKKAPMFWGEENLELWFGFVVCGMF